MIILKNTIWSHLCNGSAEFSKAWRAPIEKANIHMLAIQRREQRREAIEKAKEQTLLSRR